MWFDHRLLCSKDADGMTNSVDLEHGQSDLGLFAQTCLSEIIGSLRLPIVSDHCCENVK